jgi:general secretion pathway protein A
MYAQHFGLKQDPFSIAPDPRYLFMSQRHREALAHLLFGIAGQGDSASHAGGGFVLLTGDIGTGKTTICRCFLEQIPSGCHVAYIFNPKLTVSELLQTVCEEFHLTLPVTSSSPPTVKTYIDTLNAFLLERHAGAEHCVLIIDEAQNLQADVLEQLRLLTNLETSERKLLQIVLIGQPELRVMLERPELEQLAQRVMARFHLDALTEGESLQYITHRLAVAGHTGPLPFDRQALSRIYRLTRGVPRRINLLCGRSLLGAWANGLHRVGRTVVDTAAAEVFGPGGGAGSPSGPTPLLFALGGVFLLAVALGGWWATSPDQSPGSPGSASPVSAAPAAQAAPSATATVPDAAITEPLDALLSQLPDDMDLAWRDLGASWNLPDSAAQPCAATSTHPWQCVRVSNQTLPQLRQLDRPGILVLQNERGASVYAVLVGLTGSTATLKIGTRLHTVTQTQLARLWRGEFATYWRPPPGYPGNNQTGSPSAVFQELARQLSRIDAAPVPQNAPTTLDASLKARVRDFQRAHGLLVDGQPGPLTFMQLESVLGHSGPRLTPNSR